MPDQTHPQALPVTPSKQSIGDAANGSHRNGIPSPDIDSADEGNNLEQQAVIAAKRPSLGQSSASSDRVSFLRASPSKLPVSTFSSPDDSYSSSSWASLESESGGALGDGVSSDLSWKKSCVNEADCSKQRRRLDDEDMGRPDRSD